MKHLAQARGSRLSENSWVPVVFRVVVAKARDLTFGRRAVSLKRGGLSQARACKILQGSLLAVSPKRVSKGPWLYRDWCLNLLYGCFLLYFRLLVVCLIGLSYLKYVVCECACIIWFMDWNWWAGYEHVYETWLDGSLYVGMRLVCMINLWFGWWDMTMVWIGRNSMNLLVKVHGGASYNGRNSVNLLVRVHGGASCNGRNSTTLLVRFRGGASIYN